MPRPKPHSDEAILDATMEVLLRRGPAEFTLNDVAIELGMSRAALIQRFKNKDTLYRRVMERSGSARESSGATTSPACPWKWERRGSGAS